MVARMNTRDYYYFYYSRCTTFPVWCECYHLAYHASIKMRETHNPAWSMSYIVASLLGVAIFCIYNAYRRSRALLQPPVPPPPPVPPVPPLPHHPSYLRRFAQIAAHLPKGLSCFQSSSNSATTTNTQPADFYSYHSVRQSQLQPLFSNVVIEEF
jgi:hypothetical protein